MTSLQLILRSLLYHWRSAMGVIAGVAIATAVLTGALLVGDSVRESLRRAAVQRLGKFQHAMTTGDRLFTSDLARPDRSSGPVAMMLDLRGIATIAGSERRANGIHVIGVQKNDRLEIPGIAQKQCALGTRLAQRLDVKIDDTVTFRVAKPSALPRDIPLGSESDDSVQFTAVVGAILDDDHLGRFGLHVESAAPLNAFVRLEDLQAAINARFRANVLLSESDESPNIASNWSLADAGLDLRSLDKAGVIELRSAQVFIDPLIVDAAKAAAPGGSAVLTYLVNTLAAGNRQTPYSMIAAVEPVPEDSIDLTEWLADDLGAKPGDTLTLKYFVLGLGGALSEESATLTVRAIVPTEGPGGDRDLMPAFPGVADADRTSDWKPGIPIDLNRIRNTDEKYWKQYRGTPKAFVSLNWAQKHWANRFGGATALRWPAVKNDRAKIAEALRAKLDPRSLGLYLRPVAEEALAASRQGTDFGGLFLGLSFFLILSAVMLTALLLALSVESRSAEIGTLLALGFTPRRVRRLILLENVSLATIGATIGAPLGATYTKALLWALSTKWQAAAGATVLGFHGEPATFAIGGGGALIVSWAAILWVLRTRAAQPARALMMSRLGIEPAAPGRRIGLIAVAALFTAGAVAIAVHFRGSSGEEAAGAFFAAGSLLLIGSLLICRAILIYPGADDGTTLSLTRLARRNAARRRGRSLATISLLACGTFLLVAINAFRQDPAGGAQGRTSASGGFTLMATTALPVQQNLNTDSGREAFGLDEKTMKDVVIVGMRLREGDEASCLNLSAPTQPPLLGVDPKQFEGRFAFVSGSWASLDQADPDGAVPGIVDDSVATWILHKRVGDTIDYTDERGKPFKIRIAATLAGSALQGFMLIDEQDLVTNFPGVSGHRVFLVDAAASRVALVQQTLERSLSDIGITTTTTAARLADFAAVQNTYLAIFGVLGGLGLALGCVGLGVMVARNVLERRGELALMRSIGFTHKTVRRLLIGEHAWLLAMGVTSGVIAAAIAVIPAVRGAGGIPFVMIGIVIAIIVVSGMIWTAIAASTALRGRLIDALRSE